MAWSEDVVFYLNVVYCYRKGKVAWSEDVVFYLNVVLLLQKG